MKENLLTKNLLLIFTKKNFVTIIYLLIIIVISCWSHKTVSFDTIHKPFDTFINTIPKTNNSLIKIIQTFMQKNSKFDILNNLS